MKFQLSYFNRLNSLRGYKIKVSMGGEKSLYNNRTEIDVEFESSDNVYQ